MLGLDMSISLGSLVIFLAVALVAEIIGTVAGFGITTILLPVAVVLFGVKEAIALVGLFHFVGEVVDGIIWRKHINWRIGLLFSSLGVVFAFIGAQLVVDAPPRIIEVSLGAFLIFYGITSLTGKKLTLPKSDTALVLAGGVSGFVAGIIGTAGAVRTAALSGLKLSKEQFLGTAFAIAFLTDFVRVGVYIQTGLLHLDAVLVALVLVVATIGSLVGKALVRRIRTKTFYAIIYISIILAGTRFILG